MVRHLSAWEILADLAIVVMTGAGSALLLRALPMVQAVENWLADFRFAGLLSSLFSLLSVSGKERASLGTMRAASSPKPPDGS